MRCKITDKPKTISFTRDGIEYYFVEVTCDDGTQYGVQAFGDEALELFWKFMDARFAEEVV